MTLSHAPISTLSPTILAALRELSVTSEQAAFGGDFYSGVDDALASDPLVIGHALMLDGAPVGLFLLKRPPASPEWAPKDAVTLHALKFGSEYQGRGLGRTAMTTVIDAARAMTPLASHLMLSVDAHNTRAIALYQRVDMERTGPPVRGRVGWEHRYTLSLR